MKIEFQCECVRECVCELADDLPMAFHSGLRRYGGAIKKGKTRAPINGRWMSNVNIQKQPTDRFQRVRTPTAAAAAADRYLFIFMRKTRKKPFHVYNIGFLYLAALLSLVCACVLSTKKEGEKNEARPLVAHQHSTQHHRIAHRPPHTHFPPKIDGNKMRNAFLLFSVRSFVAIAAPTRWVRS